MIPDAQRATDVQVLRFYMKTHGEEAEHASRWLLLLLRLCRCAAAGLQGKVRIRTCTLSHRAQEPAARYFKAVTLPVDILSLLSTKLVVQGARCEKRLDVRRRLDRPQVGGDPRPLRSTAAPGFTRSGTSIAAAFSFGVLTYVYAVP